MTYLILLMTTNLIVGPNSVELTESTRPTMVTSWYNLTGNTTASGVIFDGKNKHQAAHKDLPFGTRVKLTRRTPEATITLTVTIVDRGPFVDGRDLDISKAAAKHLGIIDDKRNIDYGVVELEYEILHLAVR